MNEGEARERERSGHVGRREIVKKDGGGGHVSFGRNGSKMGPTFKEIQLAMGCWASTLSIRFHTIPSQCLSLLDPTIVFIFIPLDFNFHLSTFNGS